MKITKKLIFVTSVFFALNYAIADEWDDFGSDSDFSSTSPVVSISGSAKMSGRAYTDFREDGDSGKRYSAKDLKVESIPEASLNFDYNGSSSEVSFKLKFNKNSLGEYKADILDEFSARAYLGNFQLEAGKMKVVWGKGDKIHVVDNFNANDYTNFVYPDYIERRIAEPMLRLVYSTASNIKFEAIYTPVMSVDRLASGGIWQPYASKRLIDTVSNIASAAVADVYSKYCALGVVSGSLQSLYAESVATSTAYVALQSLVTAHGSNAYVAYNAANGTSLTASQFENLVVSASLAKTTAEGAYTQAISAANSQYGLSLTSASDATVAYSNAAAAYLTALSASSNVASNLYPDTASLKYGQAGLRSTFTLGHFDLGFNYYYGHYKQPSSDSTKVASYVTKVLSGATITEDDKFLCYDRLQVFGVEMATVLWKFNLRGEGAYYLTKDTAGDDSSVHNNSIQWVFGFDMDLPVSNVNLNVQTQGKYVLNNKKIKDSANVNDVDYNSDDKYTSNKLIVDITDSYLHENIKLDLKGIYEIETKDFVIMPSVTFKTVDDFSVTASGMLIKTDNVNSDFYNFRRNSFAQISCKYLF
ncbi:DUF3383 domain-containing protein [Treponema pectinovorum]|uniref:DUF3383 domain-containing protein n=3 Tax=Treponema pectinovorum TaxID=164 RepID=UPI0011CBE987|nr:DUF3383 domain-containing protein [Treponema pectinovorum]